MADHYKTDPESADANAVEIAADEIAAGPPKRVIQWVKLAGGADGALVPLHVAEDAAHVSGDPGIMALGVRNDRMAVALAGADGDYIPLGLDEAGALGSYLGVGKVVAGTGSATNAEVIAQTDVSRFRTAAVHLVGIAGGTLVQFQETDDPAVFGWANIGPTLVGGGPGFTSGVTANGRYVVPLTARYFRAVISTYGSGTVTAQADFLYGQTPIAALNVAGNYLSTQPVVASGQRVGLQIDERANLRVNVGSATRADTFTGTGNGTTVTLASPLRTFAVQVKGTGGVATAWDVRLEGSLNGTDFDQLAAHTDVTGDGKIVFVSDRPVLYLRSRCAGLTLGTATNIVATILGVG